MTTYTCKCGKTFQKNTEAGTTGFRMPDYGPEHECFGCPFVQKERWREDNKDIDAYACRGSKVLDYQSDAYHCDSKGATLHVRTLDLVFIQEFFDNYLALPGHTNKYLFRGMDSPENGRCQYSFNFAANKQGDAVRKSLVDRYFILEEKRPGEVLPCSADRLVRKDITPEQEKKIVLNQIKEAKAMAQGIEPAETGKKYYHHNLVYFVDKREDNEQYTVFMGDRIHLNPETTTECATIPDFPTFEQAQNALDGYAIKRGFTENPMEKAQNVTEQAENVAEPEQNVTDESESVPSTEESAEMEQEESSNSENDELDIGPDGMEELAEYQELTENDNPSESTPEQGPCDWKNASGADEDEDEPEPYEQLPDGPDLSLRLPAFDAMFNAADSALQDMSRTLKTKYIDSGELNIKIIINNYGGVLKPSSKSKVDCALKPSKVSIPIMFADDVEFTVDKDGRVILPDDREHQINFDELQPGRVISPDDTVKTTVDGSTGLVNEVHTDDWEPPTSDDMTNWAVGQEMHPCEQHDCPFFGVDDDENSGCCFDSQVDGKDKDCAGDIWEAVHMESCERPDLLEAYRRNNPDEDDGESYENADDSSDTLTFVDECNKSSCTFFDSDEPNHCTFDPNAGFYGAPCGYMADEDDVLESAEDYNCQNPALQAEYKKIKEHEDND